MHEESFRVLVDDDELQGAALFVHWELDPQPVRASTETAALIPRA